MIHVELGPAPATLRNAEFRRHRQELEEYFSVPPGEREKLRFNFASVSRYPVVAAIRKAFHDRCAYCESRSTASVPSSERWDWTAGSRRITTGGWLTSGPTWGVLHDLQPPEGQPVSG